MPVLTLAGSPAPHSRSSRLLDLAAAQLAKRGAAVDQVSLRELPAHALVHLDHRHPAIERTLGQVARASAVIVATPVYKAAYSGLLKAFLDLLPQDGLKGKVVLPIATAGTLAHALALDYALKPVLSALGARYVLGGIYAVDEQVRWSPEAGLALDPEIAERLHDGLQRLTETVRLLVRPAQWSSSTSPVAAETEPPLARCWG